MKQEISLAEFQNEPASVLHQVQQQQHTFLIKDVAEPIVAIVPIADTEEHQQLVQEKAQTLLDKVNREQALTEVEFGFLLRHAYVDEGHRSLFCDADRLRLLANFGGVSSLRPLAWEELESEAGS